MIDKKTGEIRLAPDKAIYPLMSLIDLIAMGLGESAYQDDKKNGWLWYAVRNIQHDGWYMICNFGFYENRLAHISMAMKKLKFETGQDDPWKSWDEDEEKQNATDLDNWLTGEVGSRRAFPWGNTRAAYDVRTLASSIEIGYKEPKKRTGR